MRRAMTLAEVLFALLLVAIGVIAVSALIAQGARTQHQVRFQLFAAAKAMEIADAFSQSDVTYHTVQVDRRMPLEVPVDRAGTGYDAPASDLRQRPAFTASGRFDLEQVLTFQDLGAIPVPPQIVQRLESDRDEIRGVLDAGGVLFYCDPVYVRGHTRQHKQVVDAESFPSEMHKLVFAVIGHAQHNALDSHPLSTWPHYEIYPFPPQAVRPAGLWAYDLAKGSTGSPPYQWVNERRQGTDTSGNLYQASTWNHFAGVTPAAREQGAAVPGAVGWSAWLRPWQDGHQAFRDVVHFGWAPLAFKHTNYRSSIRDKLISPLTVWPPDNELPPLPGGNRPYGERITDIGYDPDHYLPPGMTRASFAAQSFSDRPLWHRLMPPFDPTDQTPVGAYDAPPFATGTREPGKPLVGGLEMRRYYRRLALRLWANTIATADGALPTHSASTRLEDALPATINPLKGVIDPRPDLVSDWRCPHPARVLALSYLAHAAMMVTGYRPPFGFLADGTLRKDDADEQSLAFDMDGDGQPDYATAEDRQFATFAHETCIRWAVAYASENPYDWCAPRPANRPTMMDRPLYQFDLFATPAQLDARPTFWPTLAVGTSAYGSGPGQTGVATVLQQRAAPNEDSAAAWERLLLGDAGSGTPAVTVQAPQAASNLLRPFTPGERCRELVFWAVDWKTYEDAESLPSAPVDAAQIASAGAWAYGRGDHPEGRLMWTDAAYSGRVVGGGIGLGLEDSGTGSSGKFGRWGADRNGNGTFDRGATRSGQRLRAVTVGRYTIYDPVVRSSVRR